MGSDIGPALHGNCSMWCQQLQHLRLGFLSMLSVQAQREQLTQEEEEDAEAEEDLPQEDLDPVVPEAAVPDSEAEAAASPPSGALHEEEQPGCSPTQNLIDQLHSASSLKALGAFCRGHRHVLAQLW